MVLKPSFTPLSLCVSSQYMFNRKKAKSINVCIIRYVRCLKGLVILLIDTFVFWEWLDPLKGPQSNELMKQKGECVFQSKSQMDTLVLDSLTHRC